MSKSGDHIKVIKPKASTWGFEDIVLGKTGAFYASGKSELMI